MDSQAALARLQVQQGIGHGATHLVERYVAKNGKSARVTVARHASPRQARCQQVQRGMFDGVMLAGAPDGVFYGGKHGAILP